MLQLFASQHQHLGAPSFSMPMFEKVQCLEQEVVTHQHITTAAASSLCPSREGTNDAYFTSTHFLVFITPIFTIASLPTPLTLSTSVQDLHDF